MIKGLLDLPSTLLEFAAHPLEEVVLDDTSVFVFFPSSTLKRLKFVGVETVSEFERSFQCIQESSGRLTNLCFKTTLVGHVSSGTLSLPNLVKLEFDSNKQPSQWFFDALNPRPFSGC